MSFGATVDRRRLLVDLDRVLDEDLLSVIASGTDANAFELLLGNLREGIHEIATVGEGLGDLRGAIANFQSTLGHAIESLETSLTGQFQQRLLSVHSDMAKKVESVVVDVARISGAMAATSVAYEGLVQEIKQRENELTISAADIKVEALNLVKRTAETAGHFDRAAVGVSEANAALVRNLEALQTQAAVVEHGLAAAHSIATSASDLSASAVQAVDQVGGATAELSKVTAQIGEAVRTLHADSAQAERAFSAAAAHLTTSVDAQAALARELGEQAEANTDAQRGFGRRWPRCKRVSLMSSRPSTRHSASPRHACQILAQTPHCQKRSSRSLVLKQVPWPSCVKFLERSKPARLSRGPRTMATENILRMASQELSRPFARFLLKYA